MSEPTPDFLAQERLSRVLRASFRRAITHATGTEPTAPELDALVRRELPGLQHEFGSDFLLRLAQQPPPSAPPELDLPADGSVEHAWLTPAQRQEAESALWFARLHGIDSITDALRWHSVCNHAALTAPILRRCVDEFLLAKRCEKLAPTTVHAYNLRLNNFARQFGDRRPATLTPQELSDYLARWTNSTSRLAHWGSLSAFFNWLTRSRYLLENPLSSGVSRPRSKAAARLIYTPEEAAHILRLTKTTDEIGFWAVSLFAGLRDCELQRLQKQPDPWQVIDLTRGLIDLTRAPFAYASNRRTITLLPAALAWLRWMKARDIPFYPLNHWEKFRITRATVMASRYATPAAAAAGRQGLIIGEKKVYAMARRSYISYRLALTGVSYANISDESGTTERLLRSEYYRKASKEEAERYFSLKPNSV